MPDSGSKALKLGWQVACLCLLGIFVPALVTSLGYSLTDVRQRPESGARSGCSRTAGVETATSAIEPAPLQSRHH